MELSDKAPVSSSVLDLQSEVTPQDFSRVLGEPEMYSLFRRMQLLITNYYYLQEESTLVIFQHAARNTVCRLSKAYSI